MARATGIGGIFIRARDPDVLGECYRRHLGVSYNHGFARFVWREDLDIDAYAVWAPFDHDTTHHGSNEQQAMMADLAAAGVEIVPERSEDANGRFAWITDPEGNRVELGSRHAEPSKKVVS